MRTLSRAVLAGATTLLLTTAVAPAQAAAPRSEAGPSCLVPATASTPTAGRTDGRGASGPGRGLDHRDITAAQQRSISEETAQLLAAKPRGGGRPASSGQVPVYVHVMAASDGSHGVTDQQIAQQIDALNTTFAGGESSAAADAGFRFTLAGSDRFLNDTWHADRSSTSYRKATRQGGAGALNIWVVEFDLLGIATFPWDYAKKPDIDGIRVAYDAFPGGTATNYNQGDTAAHEAGHWFGLFHTFQGGCKTPGDEVADTAAQAAPSTGCPEENDTCPDLAGRDPVHNYMDYSYDSCYTEFTSGQATRMDQMWAAYRG